MTYRAALERLFALRRFGVRPGLDGVKRALAAVGEPQRGLAVLHVTGTNGKGSTAAFAESVLRCAGRRTGLYTSPHLSRFTERIRVDGVEVAPARVAAMTARILDAVPEVTFFEAATCMAFLAFRLADVDVAVIEAGLGGLLDATNVIDAPLATVVTGVALDHTEILGPTLADVALQKAGIWKAGAPALYACDDPDARRILADEARRVGARPFELGRDFALEDGRYRGPGGALTVERLGLSGAHQQRNAALALAAAALAAERRGWTLSDEARRRGLAEVRWPGRLERLDGDLIIDAAHNPDGARTLARELPSLAAGRPITLIFGAVADKDAAGMLAALRPLAARLILTRAPTARARPPEELRALVADAEVIDAPGAALSAARDGRSLVVVAGSIFLIAEVRRLVLGEPCDPIVVQDPAPQKL